MDRKIGGLGDQVIRVSGNWEIGGSGIDGSWDWAIEGSGYRAKRTPGIQILALFLIKH